MAFNNTHRLTVADSMYRYFICQWCLQIWKLSLLLNHFVECSIVTTFFSQKNEHQHDSHASHIVYANIITPTTECKNIQL